MNQPFFKIWIAIALVVLVVGGVFVWQYLTPQVEKTENETVGWQTYRNEEYGFAMRYPPGFFFEESSSGVAFIENQWRGKLVHYPLIGVEFIETSLTPKEWVDAFGTERSVFDESLPLPECVSGSQVGCLYFGVKDRKNISLGADKVSALQFYNSGVSGSNGNTLTTDTKRNVLVNIYRHSSGIGEISWDVYNQMLSTFEFLTPEELGESYIRVVSPNGGEELRAGETYTIRWSFGGNNVKNVIITLLEGASRSYLLSPKTGVDASQGKFEWKIDSNTPFVGRSNLRIVLYDVAYCDYVSQDVGGECAKDELPHSDASDNYFSIVSPNP